VNKNTFWIIAAIILLASFAGFKIVTAHSVQSVLATLPKGCSGAINQTSEVLLDCVAGNTKVDSIVFGNTSDGELASFIKCGVTVRGTSDEMQTANVSVSVLDSSGRELGAKDVANFTMKEVNKANSRFVDDSISYSKGANPCFFVVKPLAAPDRPKSE
jgi:hypothetical protein